MKKLICSTFREGYGIDQIRRTMTAGELIIPMKKLISCAFNMDTACVELRFTDGSICSIDCTAVENEVADNRFQRAELDYLIYNDPLAYADLVLNGDVEAYLNAVTEYQTYEK